MKLDALTQDQEEDGAGIMNGLVEALDPFFAFGWAEQCRFDGVFEQQSLSLGFVKFVLPGAASTASADGLDVSREICPS